MSDQDKNSVQRFSRRNRKNRLPKSDSLFPADDIPAEASSEEVSESDYMPPPELDLEALSLPDTNRDALESLSKLSPDDVRAPHITPQAERYPPLHPAAETVPNTLPPDPLKIAALKARKRRNIRNNVITVLAWMGTVAFLIWVVTIWFNPQTAWNPLPPETPFVVITATPSDAAINPLTPTANVDGQIFIVATDAATATQIATESPYPFIAPDAVMHVPNGNDLGCNWWSIAGTVTDSSGVALDGYRIRVVGEGVRESVFSGTILTFGAGGFELPLVGTPQVAEFTVQLFSPQDAPLSPPVTVTTRADCDANVAIVNFVQN